MNRRFLPFVLISYISSRAISLLSQPQVSGTCDQIVQITTDRPLSRLWRGTMGTTCARRPLSPTRAVMGNSHSPRFLPADDQGEITASPCEAAPGRETRRADRRAGRSHPPSLSHS